MTDDNELPDELLRRIYVALQDSVALADPTVRGAMMRAITADPPTITAHAHVVHAEAVVFCSGLLDESTVGRWEIPGAEVGVIVDFDGDLAWAPTTPIVR